MDLEKNKEMKMGMPVKKQEEFTGEMMIARLMDLLGFKRSQSLAELLDVHERTLSNWSEKSYSELTKQSASLKVLFDAVYEFEKAYIPPSAFLKLLTTQLPNTSQSLIQSIVSNPDNELLAFVIKWFSDRYFIDISESEMSHLLEQTKLTDDQREKLRRKFKK